MQPAKPSRWMPVGSLGETTGSSPAIEALSGSTRWQPVSSNDPVYGSTAPLLPTPGVAGRPAHSLPHEMGAYQAPMAPIGQPPTLFSEPPMEISRQVSQLRQQLTTMEQQLATQHATNEKSVNDSRDNLKAHWESLQQRRQAQIDEGVRAALAEGVRQRCAGLGIQMEDLDSRFQPVIETCTKDAIQVLLSLFLSSFSILVI